jgi:hypothetical protein
MLQFCRCVAKWVGPHNTDAFVIGPADRSGCEWDEPDAETHVPTTSFVRLTGTVGSGGKNDRADVLAIQTLINAYRPNGVPPLALDGVCGARTIAAIRAVETQFLHTAKPDGRIDPNGPTLRAMNQVLRHKDGVMPNPPAPVPTPAASPRPAPSASAPAGTKPARHHRVPPADIIAAAQKAQKTWGVPASISIAQWILESGWGRSMPAGSNNPFGIKAGKGQPSVMARTREVVHHQTVYIMAAFRVFSSIDEAFDAHGRLLATHPAYAAARAHTANPDAYANALTHTYATDDHYGEELISLMKSDELYQYNGTAYSDFGDRRMGNGAVSAVA